MNLKSIVKETIHALKKPNLKFLTICLFAAAIAGSTQTVVDLLDDSVNNSIFQSKVEDNYSNSDLDEIDAMLDELLLYADENYEAEDNSIYTDEKYNLEDDSFYTNESYDLDDTDSIFSSLNLDSLFDENPEDLFIAIGIIFIAITFFASLLGLANIVYNYFLYHFAIESVEEISLPYSNFMSVAGAKILVGLILFIDILCSLFFLFLGLMVTPLFFVISVVLLALLPYIAIRFSSINYTYVKHRGLKTYGIIRKSLDLTKGKVFKIIAYNVLIQIVLNLINTILSIIVSIFTIILGPILGGIILFIYHICFNLLVICVTTMFNVVMFKNFDISNEPNSNTLITNVQE